MEYRATLMNEKHWAGVDLKLQYSSFHLEKMVQALQPPEPSRYPIGLEHANVGNDWQRSFYPHFDAFLPCTRSVADIVDWCFGYDKKGPISKWFNTLSLDEKDRRKLFTEKFAKVRTRFDNHFLTKVRNVSMHRSGLSPVNVAFTGFYGVKYEGNATIRLSHAEVRPSDAADMGWLGSSLPLLPKWQDFYIAKVNLFKACQEYLADANDIVSTAKNISAKVHGVLTLTEPETSDILTSR